jgi:hypothetical protein
MPGRFALVVISGLNPNFDFGRFFGLTVGITPPA